MAKHNPHIHVTANMKGLSLSIDHYVRGFTLLELLVAMSIFSILASIAYGGLTVVLNNNDHHERVSQRLSALQTTHVFLQRDIEQAIYRSIRDETTQKLPALYSVPNENLLLELTRTGWQNPLEQRRSELQRISYHVKDKKLYRGYWTSLDRTNNAIKHETVMFSDFKSIQIRFLDEKNKWHSAWPPYGKDDPNDQLPIAIETTIDCDDFGSITRLFSLKNV